jgi:hypothetical protein
VSPRQVAILLGTTSGGVEAVAAWRAGGEPGACPLPLCPDAIIDESNSYAEDLERCYQNRGFIDVRVRRERVRSADGEETIVYHVDEGPCYTVRKEVAVPDMQSAIWLTKALLAEARACETHLSDQLDIAGDIERLKDWGAMHGCRVVVKTNWVKCPHQPGTVILRYEVTCTLASLRGWGTGVGYTF